MAPNAKNHDDVLLLQTDGTETEGGRVWASNRDDVEPNEDPTLLQDGFRSWVGSKNGRSSNSWRLESKSLWVETLGWAKRGGLYQAIFFKRMGLEGESRSKEGKPTYREREGSQQAHSPNFEISYFGNFSRGEQLHRLNRKPREEKLDPHLGLVKNQKEKGHILIQTWLLW